MKFLLDMIRGCAIGIASILPGISGGTLAVSMGIYDKIIDAIIGILKHPKQSILTLLPYGIGAGLGLVGLSFGIEYLFANYPLPTVLLFIGLILGGVPALWKRIKGKKVGILGILLFLFFFTLLTLLPLITGEERTDLVLTQELLTYVKLFFVGIIASATLVIPGVSGSMILMSLGYYSPILSSITGFLRAALDFNLSAALSECAFLVPFGLGVLLGTFAIAKLISYLFKKFEAYTYCAVLGLIFASPYSMITAFTISAPGFLTILISVLTLVGGLAAAFYLGNSKEEI